MEQVDIINQRAFYASEITRIQFWLSNNKESPKRKSYLLEMEGILVKLREFNKANKRMGENQNTIFGTVCKQSCNKEVLLRVAKEVTSRMNGNEPKSVSLISDADSEMIENYKSLQKKYTELKNGIKSFSSSLDKITMPNKNEPTPEEYKFIQDYNRTIGQIKRDINELLKK